MRIVVLGAGAMGGFVGARLAATGHEVTLVDTWAEHVEAISQHGLRIDGPDDTPVRYRPLASTSVPALDDIDLVLVQVKAYDTVAALSPLAHRLPSETFVLSLQNGIGNLENMQRALPRHVRLLLGTTSHGASVVAPGYIRHAGRGPTVIGDPGSLVGPRWDLTAIRDALTMAQIETRIVENVHAAVWAKLIVNAAINPITALTGVRNGILLENADLRSLSDTVVTEALAVMDAAGVPPLVANHRAHVYEVMRLTGSGPSSMLQDIRRGRRTEIDAINGAISRLADDLGVAAPVNRWLATMVRFREREALRDVRDDLLRQPQPSTDAADVEDSSATATSHNAVAAAPHAIPTPGTDDTVRETGEPGGGFEEEHGQQKEDGEHE